MRRIARLLLALALWPLLAHAQQIGNNPTAAYPFTGNERILAQTPCPDQNPCSGAQYPAVNITTQQLANWIGSGGGSGTVTSVGLADGSALPIYVITNSPITQSGTLRFTLANENPNFVFAGPASGVTSAQPVFRLLAAADIPALPYTSSFSFTNGNGFTGTVTNPSTAPALSLAPSFTGVAYSNGAGFAAAIAANFPTLNQSTSGNAGTATAAQAAGTECAGGQAARGVDAGWNAIGCFTPSGAGTVTSVALTMPSGFSVSGSPITGAGTLAISTALSGPLKGTGSGFSAAAASDIVGLFSACSGTQYLGADGACHNAGGGSGTVTSVALTLPSWLTVTGSPVTTSGTLAVSGTTGEAANQVLATPNGASGAIGLRALVAADVPTLNQSTTGNAATATALAAAPSLCSTGNAPTGILASGAATGCAPLGSSYSGTANQVVATPNGSSGAASARALVGADLPASGVTAGSYTSANISVDSTGRVTAAANGSGGGSVVQYAFVTATETRSGGTVTADTYLKFSALPAGVYGWSCTLTYQMTSTGSLDINSYSLGSPNATDANGIQLVDYGNLIKGGAQYVSPSVGSGYIALANGTANAPFSVTVHGEINSSATGTLGIMWGASPSTSLYPGSFCALITL